MLMIAVAFLMGCTVTYLVTVISSGVTAAKVLEESMLTHALLLMSAYEISTKQLEDLIVNSQVNIAKAEILRRANKEEFEKFANLKIDEIRNMIPTAHLNIIRYTNFKEMNEYITDQFRSKNVRLDKKI
tara:strand:- start:34 stop:420 length:387 start_codon:yes stop_codon:yes gene_type:complete